MTTHIETRALLSDGTVIALREASPEDAQALRELRRELPDRYPLAENDTVLCAFSDDELIGAAAYAPSAEDETSANVVLVVASASQSRGVGTLLLEHLVSLARGRGVRRFTADLLSNNPRMLALFSELGLVMTATPETDVVRVDLGLDGGEDYLDAVANRELTSGVASLRAVLKPSSIVVIGAGRNATSVGHAVLANLVKGEFAGELYAVNPKADELLGVTCYPSVAELPVAPDLAVICVPAAAVPAVAEDCGKRGVKAMVVVTSGVDPEPLLASVHKHGMRMVGPNCIGVASTDPEVRMDATFTRKGSGGGGIGLVTQSGGVAIAVLEQLSALGMGTTDVVSTGDKYDVSGNDLLLWWERDERTTSVVLYLESFGNPRKFSRLARRVARQKPVLAIRSATSEAGQRAAASHTASTATPAVTQEALFRQAGVIVVDGIAELVEVLAALENTPLPQGRSVAVVSNAGGLGVLAADACSHNGLTVADLSEDTTAKLAALLPSVASTTNPVDTTAVLDADVFAQCVDVVAADPAVDAVIAVTVPTALGNPAEGIRTSSKPVLAVAADQLGSVAILENGIASYADPVRAAESLAALVQRAEWLRRPAPSAVDLPGIDVPLARKVVAEHFAVEPEGGWLEPDQVVRLLSAFGLPILGGVLASDVEGAVAAQKSFGQPIAMKAVARGVLHKSKAGGVKLNLGTPERVAEEFTGMQERFGDRLQGVFIQPMAESGRELLVGVVSDQRFGPLVVTGLGGVDTDLLDDRAAALAPLTSADVDDLLRGFRASAKVFEQHPEEPVHDVLLRVSRLAEMVPEIAELDLNPLVVKGERVIAVDARVRLEPVAPVDPYLRALRRAGA
ncbi:MULTISPECIES: bifunctional GNAT family N-acetyltransferase/acetate--CoA ligase family protein [Actinosynnema]|uniref:bifunctional acetate--CoA ligase family protein/GNAT family N-acetyltransferase n=1 Tax=Actinosynnema TaxID=40566 RepID=UPI0020A28B67|nr:bifunctional GNAT family N-acetyltransferase/acetate--CoA ligase family protein [Actinosynnema pretiosum]MCP2099104.1 Acyl-CoA synthetase (NDP forming) [Actinosynnema pretiosum]